MTAPTLAAKIEGITAHYGAVESLHEISLEVAPGELVCVLGPNGAGKTSLLRAMSGLLPIRQGSIQIFGENIRGWKPWMVARAGVAHVPQGRRCFASLTVEENLTVGGFRLPRDDAQARCQSVYELFPVLKEKSRQIAAELSGGQQQMLAIGRGLMLQPALLLLDEPSLGLSPVLVREMSDSLRRLAREFRTAVLLVEQNTHMALRIAQRGYVLQGGRCVLEGVASHLARHVQLAYLGERT